MLHSTQLYLFYTRCKISFIPLIMENPAWLLQSSLCYSYSSVFMLYCVRVYYPQECLASKTNLYKRSRVNI